MINLYNFDFNHFDFMNCTFESVNTAAIAEYDFFPYKTLVDHPATIPSFYCMTQIFYGECLQKRRLHSFYI